MDHGTMPASHYSRPGINTDPGRRWQTVDCTWTLSLGHFLNLKKNFKFKFKCVLKLKLSHSCLELELLNLLLTHTQAAGITIVTDLI